MLHSNDHDRTDKCNSCRPDLAKGLRARGQFQVARLLGQYAAAEQASPPPSRPPGFPTPLEIISPVDAQTPNPTVPETPPPPSKRNGGLSPPSPARIPIENPADSAPKIPASIFDQLEADGQRAPASEKGARSGAKGIPLPSRDPQATTAAVEWLRQLGSVSGKGKRGCGRIWFPGVMIVRFLGTRLCLALLRLASLEIAFSVKRIEWSECTLFYDRETEKEDGAMSSSFSAEQFAALFRSLLLRLSVLSFAHLDPAS